MQLDTFANEIRRQLAEAEASGAESVRLNAGEIHRILGGYPSKRHAMPTCCAAMYAAKTDRDRVVSSPPSGKGASLTIDYVLPRG